MVKVRKTTGSSLQGVCAVQEPTGVLFRVLFCIACTAAIFSLKPLVQGAWTSIPLTIRFFRYYSTLAAIQRQILHELPIQRRREVLWQPQALAR